MDLRCGVAGACSWRGLSAVALTFPDVALASTSDARTLSCSRVHRCRDPACAVGFLGMGGKRSDGFMSVQGITILKITVDTDATL